MVKIRKAKGKIWAKRQSCSSNPSISSHRDAAKRGFREEGQARSNLTVEAIARHNEHDDDEDVILDEVETTGKSDGNFSISGLTDCSNSTFSVVLKRFWQSPGANHREVGLRSSMFKIGTILWKEKRVSSSVVPLRVIFLNCVVRLCIA